MSDPRPRQERRAIGVSGLSTRGGVIEEEWLRELQGDRGAKVIRQMLADPLIGGIFLAIELLIRQVPWTVTDASDDPADVAAGDFVREAFDALRPGWTATLPELLSFLPHGWALLEIVYTTRPDGRTGWESWGIRAQETRARWLWDDAGRPVAMVQRDPDTGREVPIPLEKCIHVQTTSRKGNPEGVSLLRAVYRPWYFRGRIETIEGIGIERDLAGLPVIRVPGELMDPEATSADKAVLDAYKKIVVNIRRDEQEGVILPSDRDERGNLLYELELLTAGGERQFDTSAIIGRYKAEMAMALLADFMLLGHEKVGSFALSSDKTELFSVALGAWLDTIARAVSEQAFARLCALNSLPGKPPTLEHGDIETADLGVLGTFLTALTGAGATLFPNDVLLQHLLTQAGLPVPVVETVETPDPEPAPDPMPPPSPPPAPGQEPPQDQPPAQEPSNGNGSS